MQYDGKHIRLEEGNTWKIKYTYYLVVCKNNMRPNVSPDEFVEWLKEVKLKDKKDLEIEEADYV